MPPWKGGQSGNPNGRPRLQLKEKLYRAMQKEAANHGGHDLVRHAVREAYTDNWMLAQILKKLIPDLKQIEADIRLSGGIDFTGVSDDELDRRITEIEGELGIGAAAESKEGGTIQPPKRKKIKKRP